MAAYSPAREDTSAVEHTDMCVQTSFDNDYFSFVGTKHTCNQDTQT